MLPVCFKSRLLWICLKGFMKMCSLSPTALHLAALQEWDSCPKEELPGTTTLRFNRHIPTKKLEAKHLIPWMTCGNCVSCLLLLLHKLSSSTTWSPIQFLSPLRLSYLLCISSFLCIYIDYAFNNFQIYHGISWVNYHLILVLLSWNQPVYRNASRATQSPKEGSHYYRF